MRKVRIVAYIQSALLIALGILAIASPSRIVAAIPIVMGIILMLVGLGKLLAFFLSGGKWRTESDLVLGAVSFILGLLFLIRQEQALNIIAVLWGVIAVATAISRLYAAARRIGSRRQCWFELVSGLIGLGLGIALLFSMDATLAFHVILAGVYILFAGLMLLVSTFLGSRSLKAVKEEQLEDEAKKVIDIKPPEDDDDWE